MIVPRMGAVEHQLRDLASNFAQMDTRLDRERQRRRLQEPEPPEEATVPSAPVASAASMLETPAPPMIMSHRGAGAFVPPRVADLGPQTAQAIRATTPSVLSLHVHTSDEPTGPGAHRSASEPPAHVWALAPSTTGAQLQQTTSALPSRPTWRRAQARR